MSQPNIQARTGGGGDGKGDRHWADRAAEEIVGRGVDRPVVATGISPSGPFHVGHLREILTGDAVARALRERGAAARLVFIVDNLDPLRKVYPFLDEKIFGPLVGRSLCEIPGPDGKGRYDEHFLAPFLDVLEQLHVEAEVLPASELYGSGRMNDVVFAALERRDRIASLLEEVTGKTIPPEWSPWNPRDPDTGRITSAEALDFDREEGWVRFRVIESGREHRTSVAGGGKLTWRVDWPARWKALGVTAEPFGKDHASRGGSYDSGIRLAREVFETEPPHPIVYEWISLRGQGDMAASKGNVLEPSLLLEMVPPEVLRYLVMKARPTKAIRFDPGLPLLRLVDEVDEPEAKGRDARALELSRAAGFQPVGVPFKHLVLVAQIAGFDTGRAIEILERGGYEGLDEEALSPRIAMARRWIERFAPDEVKVELARQIPASVSELSPAQKSFLGRLAELLPGLREPEEIQQAIRELAAGEEGPGVAQGFQAVYRTLIDRDRGPRAGAFIAFLGTSEAAGRFAEASRS